MHDRGLAYSSVKTTTKTRITTSWGGTIIQWVLTHHRDSHPAMVAPTDAIVAKDINDRRVKG